jgi:hypothetical protein
VVAGDGGDWYCDRAENELARGRRAELSPPIFAETAGKPPRGHAAGEEAGEGEQRARDREAARAGCGEAEEDDVAGHVGHEHMPERQVGERVDDSGHDREDDQQRR